MEFQKLIEKRRSVRKYSAGHTIPKEDILEMIRAAQEAPSWKNSQTSRYYVVTSREMLEKVKTSCLPEFNQKNCKDAPVLIVTAFVKNHSGHDSQGCPVNELGNGWGAYDLGLHDANLILKARELGLDTLIMGIRDADALREILGIDGDQEVVSVIAVGYRDIDPAMPARKSVEEIARFY